MARINVETMALTDSRFQTLGRLLGVDRYAALGRMIYIWHECQERETYTLTDDQLSDIHPEISSLGKLLVEAHLATFKGHGSYYIHGTRGRIEWLASRRREGRLGGVKGGRPKKPVGDNQAETPRGLPQKTPLSLALALTLKDPPSPPSGASPPPADAGGGVPPRRKSRSKPEGWVPPTEDEWCERWESKGYPGGKDKSLAVLKRYELAGWRLSGGRGAHAKDWKKCQDMVGLEELSRASMRRTYGQPDRSAKPVHYENLFDD